MKLALLLLMAAQIIEVYPNPYGSDGAEYVKFYCSSSCMLTDGEGQIFTGKGLHIATKNMSEFRDYFGFDADIEFPKRFALSNRGENLCLETNTSKDCFHYGKDIKLVDEGVIYYRTESGWDFRYEDWSNFPCIRDKVRGRLIITPADYTLGNGWIVAGYTFSASFQPSKLYVDASPKNIPCREIEIPDTVFLSANSYRNFHYKFAVKENDVVITTENWIFTKKGYIVEFKSEKISDFLLKLLENDEKYSSKKPEWCSEWRISKVGSDGKHAKFTANVTLFVIPDCNPVLDFISSAHDRLYIIAPYMKLEWYSEERELLKAIKKAMENGAHVTVVLNSKYADRDVMDVLEGEGVNVILTEKLHGKAIVSDDRLLVTSANMNLYGLKLNREIGIIIDSRELANFVIDDIKNKKISVPDFTIALIAFIISSAIFMKYRRM